MITNIDKIVEESKASQNKAELRELLRMLFAYRSSYRVILEIGIHFGHNLHNLARAFNPDILIGIESDVSHFKAFTTYPHPVISGSSHDIETMRSLKSLIGERKIDLLFIDGDHSFEGVKQDYEEYSKYLSKGGVIVIHDIESEAEVKKFWESIQDSITNFKTIKHKEGNGYAVIFKS